jgi:hypothetical protein
VNLSLTAQLLWAAGFIEHAALLTVLIVRGRWRTFPVFTTLIGFNALRTILLASLYRFSSPAVYSYVYQGATFIDLALQLGVILELARVVLKPTGTWVSDARKMFLTYGVAGGFLAAVIAYAINPISSTTLDLWIEKAELFSAMLTLELFAAMLMASARLGLVGSNHVMRLGQGWAIWAIADLIAEGGYSHFGPNDWRGATLDQIRTGTYFCVTIFWIITLWRSEPERRTLSAEMQAYLDGLHVRLQSDLKRVSSIEKQ